MQGDTRHSGWLPHGKLLVWAEPLCLPFIYRLAVPAADHPCTSLPGTARAAGAASFPWRGGKDLFDQTLPSRAVNQSPGNASSTRAPAPPAKSPNTIQPVKAVRRICLMRILQHRAGSKVSHQNKKASAASVHFTPHYTLGRHQMHPPWQGKELWVLRRSPSCRRLLQNQCMHS